MTGDAVADSRLLARTGSDLWSTQWDQVPASWRTASYRLDQQPSNEVFTRNANYLRSPKEYSFAPAGPPRLAQELAWWVWTCWQEGLRKIEPSMLHWWRTAVDHLITLSLQGTGAAPDSLALLHPNLVVKHALLLFQARNNRLPSPGNRRNLESIAEHIHLMVSVRCATDQWWAFDTWNLRADPRIPRREHEPALDRSLLLGPVSPTWLREGIRFWLRMTLSHGMYAWTTAHTRATSVGRMFGGFCDAQGISDPSVGESPEAVRLQFVEFLGYLRSPRATHSGSIIGPNQVSAIQSHVQSFYTFMLDHSLEAVEASGDTRWASLGEHHARLWTPALRRARTTPSTRHQSWISTADMQQMISVVHVLGADTHTTVSIDGPDGPRQVTGVGDEQAMRAWLIQAMTGRRASEILMLDFDPLTALPPEVVDGDAPDRFVARMRYQQTKVDGVEPSILVEQAVVNIIQEQQRWARQRHPRIDLPYLFLGPRHNHRGDQPRGYRSYCDALKRLDRVVTLTDETGAPLRFTQTHRLRHTRATELLNAGVPQHVVQRYLGHKSPEMTMRYAATLETTAEAEFLRYKKFGADGKPLDLSPRDMYDLVQLDRRTDRILPNGVCLLPPMKTCEMGNACLPCPHFATDATHIEELRHQLAATRQLLANRRTDFQQRFNRPLGEDNIWVKGRLREIASLEGIVERLERDDTSDGAVVGPGTRALLPVTVQQQGSHHDLIERHHRSNDAPGSTHGDPSGTASS